MPLRGMYAPLRPANANILFYKLHMAFIVDKNMFTSATSFCLHFEVMRNRKNLFRANSILNTITQENIT